MYLAGLYISPWELLFWVAEYTFSPIATRSGLMLKSAAGPSALKDERIRGVVGFRETVCSASISTCVAPACAARKSLRAKPSELEIMTAGIVVSLSPAMLMRFSFAILS